MNLEQTYINNIFIRLNRKQHTLTLVEGILSKKGKGHVEGRQQKVITGQILRNSDGYKMRMSTMILDVLLHGMLDSEPILFPIKIVKHDDFFIDWWGNHESFLRLHELVLSWPF